MNRLTAILFCAISVILISCSNKKPARKSTASIITRNISNRDSLFKDSLFLRGLARAYGDNIYEKIDSLKNDSSFLKQVYGLEFSDWGEFVSEAITLEYSIEPMGWVSDYGFLFTQEQKTTLDSISRQFEKETGNEIAILTMADYWTTAKDFDSVVRKIFNDWGVGKKERNNGVLIAISESLRKVRINNGYGVEKKMSDAETKLIIENIIIPAYKTGNFFEGTKKGLLAIMEKIR